MSERRTFNKNELMMLEVSFFTAGYHDEKLEIIYISGADLDVDGILFRDDFYVRVYQFDAVEEGSECHLNAFKKIGKLES